MSAAGARRFEVHGTGGVAAGIRDRAASLGLLGWARDDDDAGVARVHAEGGTGALDELAGFLAGLGRVEERTVKVEGHEQFAVRGVPAGAFVVREHGEGFDLCLEVGGQPRVWRLRRPPAMDPAVRRMAIAIDPAQAAEDAATWDAGPYEQGGRVPWPEALERGHAVFVVHGSTLRGGFALQRTRGAQWLLVKRRDEHARAG